MLQENLKAPKLRYRRVITMAGIGVQDPGIRVHDPGIGVHDGSESVFRMVRNTHLRPVIICAMRHGISKHPHGTFG